MRMTMTRNGVASGGVAAGCHGGAGATYCGNL